MYNCQQSIIKHLAAEFTSPTVYTIKEYAGDLQSAEKISEILPAILVIFIDGRPMADQKEHEFDLLVITENRALIAETANSDNLNLASDVADYLQEHPIIPAHGRAGSYEVIRELTRARTILNDVCFCIIVISLVIKDWTK